MKHRILLLLTVILVLALVFMFSWFHVDGDEIPCLQAVSEHYTGFVNKTPISQNSYDSATYTLTEAQVLQLKELFLSSRFRRSLSHSYSYKGMRDIYSIVLECDNNQGQQVDFIKIFIVEDHYVSIAAPYTEQRFTLKILDPQFCDKLDYILFGPYPFE